MKRQLIWRTSILLLTASLLLTACGGGLFAPAATATPTTPPPTPTATPVPPRALTVCLGEEPQTLYPYGSSSRATWAVLDAIYDGPVDTVNYVAQPVILESIPSQSGGMTVTPVAVSEGDVIVDASGNLSALASGVSVFPTGCTSSDCAVAWDGVSALQMDQVSMDFRILQGILWSDGTPLTAADSVYSFQVAADPASNMSQNLVSRTVSYTDVDSQTVRWVGVPGLRPSSPADYFWMPLPKHAWGSLAVADLATSEMSSRAPLGWGPYVVSEWAAGDHITLNKNTNYFRASEGLPYFDILVYRFVEPGETALQALQTGECDLLDSSALTVEQLASAKELNDNGAIRLYTGMGPEWEQVSLNIRPVSYDDGSTYGDRADFFSDVRVRQAFAYCMDRQGIVDTLLQGESSVPASFLTPNHPYYASDLTALPFDPQQGMALLDEAGWTDADGDPSTPRVSAYDAELIVNYTTTQAPLRQQVADMMKTSLGLCGIGVNILYLDAADLYAPGPEGVLFGRQYDLAEFAWTAGKVPPCYLYLSNEIPSAANMWVGNTLGGPNVTGYASAELDTACNTALRSGSDQETARQQYIYAQQILARDLPSIPLFYQVKMDAARTDLCNWTPDTSSRSDLTGIETIKTGEGCGAQ